MSATVVTVGYRAGRAIKGFADKEIGRQTNLGNPFEMKIDGTNDERMRETVCDMFDRWMDSPLDTTAETIAGDRSMWVEVDDGAGGKRRVAPERPR